jgi:nicotinamidase/pyrazinamidase
MKFDLIVIDPQNDFCDPNGSLFVKGADEDMRRLADHINSKGDKYNQIHVTLDSHPAFHIAHPVFWINSSGQHPAPFTTITVADVKNNVWMTSVSAGGKLRKYGLDYVTALEAGGRYPLCIWPPHCLIGSWGTMVHPILYNALRKWEDKKPGRSINYVAKGSNPYTEHYGAVKADVPDLHQAITGEVDVQTQLNMGFLRAVDKADRIVICGEASSHCVANTARDMDEGFGGTLARKLVFLKNASSPVGSFEHLADKFVTDMSAKGMTVETTLSLFN